MTLEPIRQQTSEEQYIPILKERSFSASLRKDQVVTYIQHTWKGRIIDCRV
jgi:hypothetical protein